MSNCKYGNVPVAKMPEYHSWRMAIQRCHLKSNKNYALYGGRGIKVCKRWRFNFANFLRDMGERPSLLHTLDRIDNDGDYSPENCRWATRKEQRRNQRRDNHLNKEIFITDYAEKHSIKYATLVARLSKGWTLEEALFKPINYRWSEKTKYDKRKVNTKPHKA